MSETVLNIPRKKDGFSGQKAIVLPQKIIKSFQNIPLINPVYITDIGYYPKAKFHYRRRDHGTAQNILIYCTDGSGWLQFEGKRIQVLQGNFIILPMNKPHKYWSDEVDPWSIYWLHFQGSLADDFVDALSSKGTKYCKPVTFSNERTKLFDAIYDTLEAGYSTDNLSYINMCLWHYLSSFCYPDIFLLPKVEDNQGIIDVSIRLMKENLHAKLSLNELASKVYVSPSYYSALFKKKTGYSPLEYFNQMKMQKACQYLQFTTIHIKEIGYKLGINDPYYFSRLFTNIMGQSPLEYRNKKIVKR